MPAPAHARLALGGLLQVREVWVPTWRGWLLLLVALGGLTGSMVFGLYPFLAIDEPLNSGVLAVEGWANRTTLRQAGERSQAFGYQGFYVTGGPIESDNALQEYGTYAALGASELRKIGAPPALPVPAPRVRKDRTYASAVALRDALREKGGVPSEVTVVSQGAHARRTRLLFQKAFGDQTRVGVLAARVEDGYDPKRWWTYSAGFRDVIGEAIAYLYARLLFWK